ncbi:phage integrase, N-terminal SAM-like domain protein, partial [Chlamydia psittaci 06-1683]
RTS